MPTDPHEREEVPKFRSDIDRMKLGRDKGDESWNDVQPVDRPENYGQVLASADFGDPPVDADGDWVPLYEAAAEVCDLPVAQVIRSLGQDLIRWRVVQGQVAPELELWLADVAALPGTRL